jgi:protein-L-isoaspartate O-methyltransferase
VHLRVGDGYRGRPECAPFDVILVMASADPGRSEARAEPGAVDAAALRRRARGVFARDLFGVRFVPFLGARGE